MVGIAVDALLACMPAFAVLQLAGQAGIAAALPVEAVAYMCAFQVHKTVEVGEDIVQLVQHSRFALSAVSLASEADTPDIAVAAVADAGMHSVAVAVGYTVETVVAEARLDIGTFAVASAGVACVVAAYSSVGMVEPLAHPFASAVPFSASPSPPSFHAWYGRALQSQPPHPERHEPQHIPRPSPPLLPQSSLLLGLPSPM